uniref:Uncharacterized protein n=1 Tax=Arion vulgaris TaxID=1028688 RepID=A0A0B7A0A4_9EUPU
MGGRGLGLQRKTEGERERQFWSAQKYTNFQTNSCFSDQMMVKINECLHI